MQGGNNPGSRIEARLATTQELLDEALVAYHLLQTGNKPRVIVDQNGERIEYTAANPGGLSRYIEYLKTLLKSPADSLRSRRPMGVRF